MVGTLIGTIKGAQEKVRIIGGLRPQTNSTIKATIKVVVAGAETMVAEKGEIEAEEAPGVIEVIINIARGQEKITMIVIGDRVSGNLPWFRIVSLVPYRPDL